MGSYSLGLWPKKISCPGFFWVPKFDGYPTKKQPKTTKKNEKKRSFSARPDGTKTRRLVFWWAFFGLPMALQRSHTKIATFTFTFFRDETEKKGLR